MENYTLLITDINIVIIDTKINTKLKYRYLVDNKYYFAIAAFLLMTWTIFISYQFFFIAINYDVAVLNYIF